jgi:hypothetical protein
MSRHGGELVARGTLLEQGSGLSSASWISSFWKLESTDSLLLPPRACVLISS